MSKIAWTEQTWNPIVGCSHASPGCDNCYAEKMAARLCYMNDGYYKMTPYHYVVHTINDELVEKPEYAGWNGKTAFVASALDKPLKRKKPTMYFVGSMTDMFHETVDPEWLDKIFAVMALCPQHTFQVLTKRADRMLHYLTKTPKFHNHYAMEICNRSISQFLPYKNVWLGVTAENQAMADKRISYLLKTPAAVRFVSVEPMLSEISFNWKPYFWQATGETYREYLERTGSVNQYESLKGIDWVICGCESGPKRRGMSLTAAHELRRQCFDANVPFFMKQLNDKWGNLVKDFNQFPIELQVREYPKQPERA